MTFIIYLLPFLADVCVGIFLFTMPVIASNAGASPLFIAGYPVIFSVCYLGTSVIMSRLRIDRSTSFLILRVTIIVIMAVAAVAFIFPLPHLFFVYAFVLGMVCALFFVSFQVLMDAVSKDQPLYCNVSNYNISWSLGLGIGPFISGAVYGLGPSVPFLFILLCGVGVLVLLAVVKKSRLKEIHSGCDKPDRTRVTPNMLILGWALILIGASSGTFLRVMFPDHGLKLGLGEFNTGALVLIFLGTQAAVSFGMRYWYKFIEKYKLLLPITLIAVCAFVSIGFARSFPLLVPAFVLAGVFGALAFFYAIYYSLADAKHSLRNVSINESLVGISGILAPFGMGSIATAVNYSAAFTAVAVFVGVIFLAAFVYYLRPIAKR